MKTFRTSIGYVCKIVGVSVHTLRYWESKFSPLLSPERTAGNQRQYSLKDIHTLQEIKRLVKEEGYSIAGAKRKMLLLREPAGSKNGTTAGSHEVVTGVDARRIIEDANNPPVPTQALIDLMRKR